MKWHFLLLITLFPYLIAAQESASVPKDSLILLDSILFKVGFLRKYDLKRQFTKGDRIRFSFQEADGKGISKIKVIVEPTDFVAATLEQPINTGLIDLPIQTSGTHTFRFLNRILFWPKARRCAVGIWKLIQLMPPPPLEDFVTFDTTWYYFRDSLVMRDTFWLPLLEERMTINPKLDLHTISRTVLELTLPAEVETWCYWLGVGPEGERIYNQWTEALAAKWPSPLHAYARGFLPDMPLNGSGARTTYFFTENGGQANFLSGGGVSRIITGNRGIRADYGRVEKRRAVEEKAYLCLENAETASSISVLVKAVGMSIVKKVEHYPDSTIRHIQVRINVDTAGKTWPEIEQTLSLYQSSIGAARAAKKKYPLPLDSIAQALTDWGKTYRTPAKIPVSRLAYDDSTLIHTLLNVDIPSVGQDIDTLELLINQPQPFQNRLLWINDSIAVMKVLVDTLIDRHNKRLLSEPDAFRRFVLEVHEILQQIIELEPVRVESAPSSAVDSTTLPQTIQAIILSDSIQVLQSALRNLSGPISDQKILKQLQESIGELERAIEELKKEKKNDLPAAATQDQAVEIRTEYNKIVDQARNLQAEILGQRDFGKLNAEQKAHWLQELRELRHAMQLFLQMHALLQK